MKERFFPLFPDGRRGVSIAAKLALMIVAGVGAVFLAIVFYGYSTSREALEEEFQGRMENLGRAAESQFLQIPMVAEAVTRDLATMITLFEPPPEKMPEMMKELLASHSQVTGLYVGFSKQATNPLFRNFCPLVFRQGNSIQYKNLAAKWTGRCRIGTSFLQMGKPLWTEPFFADERAESMMIAYGIPSTTGTGVIWLLSARRSNSTGWPTSSPRWRSEVTATSFL